MNRFYQYSRSVQYGVSALLFLIAGSLLVVWTFSITQNLSLYLLIFFCVPVMQFCLSPLMTLSGVYKYLSPMLLVYSPTAKKYDLHNGTSFDYLWVMRKVKPGRPVQTTMLAYYVAGLLEIIRELEAGEIPPDITITGTSYFFSTSTIERLGFSPVPASNNYKLNFLLNYLDLLWMYSLSKGKLSFPNLKNIKAVAITGKDLQEKKPYLERLQRFLQSRTVVVKPVVK